MFALIKFLSFHQDRLTVLHYAVQNSQPAMVKMILDRLKLGGTSRDSDAAHQLVAITDSDGWSISHMAAHLAQTVSATASSFIFYFSGTDGTPMKAYSLYTIREK